MKRQLISKYTKDYIKSMYLQEDRLDDFIIAGITTFEKINIKADWKGRVEEKRYISKYKLKKIGLLLKDSTKTKEILKWQSKYNHNALIGDVVKSDLKFSSKR